MDFLDKLVLPQSSEHIELLHYMMILILFLFIPFISIILGGASLSLYFSRKGDNTGNKTFVKFSKDIIDLVTINKSIGIILGIVPLFTSILVFAQLLHSAQVSTISYLAAALFLVTVGVILIYTYRYSLSFKRFFEIVKDHKTDDPYADEEIHEFRKGNESLYTRSGIYGLIALFFGLWFFTAAVTLALYPEKWADHNSVYFLFSWNTLSRLLQLVTGAFGLTGAAVLFGFFYWEGGRKINDDIYLGFIKELGIRITLTSLLVQPLFILINIFALPEDAFSTSVFLFSFLALLLLFLLYHFLIAMIKEKVLKYSGSVFYLVLFTILFLIIADQMAMSNSTRKHTAVLTADFDSYLADLKGETGEAAQVNGREIYTARCESCHAFDRRVVGPPHNEVLPKYEGKIEQLVAFIRNPVKVNPAYPPMPNPGLKPAEAEAVATYMMEEFKSTEEGSGQEGK